MTVENEKGEKKNPCVFRFLSANTLTRRQSRLVQEKAKVLQCYVMLPSHALLVRVFNVLVFSLQSAINLFESFVSVLFLSDPQGGYLC